MKKLITFLKEKLSNFCPIFRHFRKKIAPNPWVTYEELENLYFQIKEKKNINKEILNNLGKYLSLAKNELCSVIVNYVYFWKLLHRAKVESLLLIDRDDFKLEAVNIINQFDNIVDDDHLKQVWLGTNWKVDYLNKILNGDTTVKVDGILPRSLQIFVSNPNLSEKDELKIRNNFKNALKLLYDYFIDGNVYKLSLTYLYINYSTLGFLAIFILFLPMYKEEVFDKFAPVLVPGFLGALMGNVITYRDHLPNEIFLLAIRGVIFKPFIYHVIGKGIIGSFAAYLIYKSSEAGILFSLQSINPAFKDPTIVVLAFVAGFSGIALVNKFVDGVLRKITDKLEKSKSVRDIYKKSNPKVLPPTKRGEK